MALRIANLVRGDNDGLLMKTMSLFFQMHIEVFTGKTAWCFLFILN